MLCTARKRIPTTSLRTGLGMTTGGILPPVIILIYRQRRHHSFPLSTFIFHLTIDNRSSEGIVIASRLKSGVAIRNPCRHRRRGALHRRKTDSHDQFANWSRNDNGSHFAACNYFNLSATPIPQFSTFHFHLSIVNCQFVPLGNSFKIGGMLCQPCWLPAAAEALVLPL